MGLEDSISKMKVVILAAGNATRCQPLSFIYNKPMLPIGDIPLIGRIMNSFMEIGLRNFYIIYGNKKSQIIPYIDKVYVNNDISVELIQQPTPMGMADAVLLTKEKLLSASSDLKEVSCFITAGDVLFTSNMISKMLHQHFQEKSIATLGTFQSSDPFIGARYANILQKDNNKVTKIIEKPGKNNIISQYFSMPIYIFSVKMFSFLEKVPISIRGEKEIQDGIQMAINAGKSVLSSNIISKSIDSSEDGQYHLTYPRDFLAMNWRLISEYSNVQNHNNASILSPVAGSNYRIGKNSIVGPNVFLASKSMIGNSCNINHTYCFPNCHIQSNCHISNSIIGETVTIPEYTEEESKIFLPSGIYPLL
jgi:NDP-sugar pyrophosphorylase family protein